MGRAPARCNPYQLRLSQHPMIDNSRFCSTGWGRYTAAQPHTPASSPSLTRVRSVFDLPASDIPSICDTRAVASTKTRLPHGSYRTTSKVTSEVRSPEVDISHQGFIAGSGIRGLCQLSGLAGHRSVRELLRGALTTEQAIARSVRAVRSLAAVDRHFGQRTWLTPSTLRS
jgi:hypothetical protein